MAHPFTAYVQNYIFNRLLKDSDFKDFDISLEGRYLSQNSQKSCDILLQKTHRNGRLFIAIELEIGRQHPVENTKAASEFFESRRRKKLILVQLFGPSQNRKQRPESPKARKTEAMKKGREIERHRRNFSYIPLDILVADKTTKWEESCWLERSQLPLIRKKIRKDFKTIKRKILEQYRRSIE